MSNIAEIMGKNLHRLRKESGYSLEQMAIVCGVHKNTLWKLENGKGSTGKVQMWVKICERLGCRMEDMMKEGGERL